MTVSEDLFLGECSNRSSSQLPYSRLRQRLLLVQCCRCHAGAKTARCRDGATLSEGFWVQLKRFRQADPQQPSRTFAVVHPEDLPAAESSQQQQVSQTRIGLPSA